MKGAAVPVLTTPTSRDRAGRPTRRRSGRDLLTALRHPVRLMYPVRLFVNYRCDYNRDLGRKKPGGGDLRGGGICLLPGFFAPPRQYRSLRRNAIRQIIQTSVGDSVCRPSRGGHVGNPTVLAVWRLAAIARSIENRFTGHFACPDAA